MKKIAKKDSDAKEQTIETLKKFSKENAIYIGKRIYKIRMRRVNSGKSGGYRLLIILRKIQKELIPICIYSKTEQENISLEEINQHLEKTINEIGEQYR